MLLDNGQEHVHNWVLLGTDELGGTGAKVHVCDNHRYFDNKSLAFRCWSVRCIMPDEAERVAEVAAASQDDTGLKPMLAVGPYVPPPVLGLPDA